MNWHISKHAVMHPDNISEVKSREEKHFKRNKVKSTTSYFFVQVFVFKSDMLNYNAIFRNPRNGEWYFHKVISLCSSPVFNVQDFIIYSGKKATRNVIVDYYRTTVFKHVSFGDTLRKLCVWINFFSMWKMKLTDVSQSSF